jgi:outer membrane protein
MTRILCSPRIWSLITLWLLLSVAPPLRAEQGKTPDSSGGVALTLGNAIQKALANNPRLAAVQCEVDASAARLIQARSGLLPQVNVSESFSRTTNPTAAFGTKLNQEVITQSDFNPAVLNDPAAVNNFTTTLSVTLPVFDSGQTWIGLSQAKLDEKAVNLAAARIRQEVAAETVIAYVGVQLAIENLHVVEQALTTAGAHLNMVRSRLQSGLVVKSDFLRAEVHLADLEQQRLQAQSQVEVAHAALNAAMGIAVEQAFRLTSRLERGPALHDPLEAWTRRALAQRPDLGRMRYQETMMEKEISKRKAAHLPSLYLSGSYEINSEDFSESANNYSVGAMMRLNLFSGYGVQSKVAEATANLRRVQAMIQQLELGITLETKQAFLQAESSWQRIAVAEAALSQAEEGLRIVRNRYENGLYTIVDLLDAEVALQQARTNYVRSLHDYAVAKTRLALAAGNEAETSP